MENLSLMLFLSIIIPLTMALFIFGSKERTYIIFLMFGIISCFFCSELNGFIYNNLGVSLYTFTTNISPITEEIAKSYPLFIYTFFFKPSKGKLIGCSLITGIGFSIFENAYTIASNLDSVSIVIALIRGFGAGMMHGICTLAIGWGIGLVYTKKKLVIPGSVAMMCVAVSYHSIYNNLVQSQYSIVGYIMPIVTFIPLVFLFSDNKYTIRFKRSDKNRRDVQSG